MSRARPNPYGKHIDRATDIDFEVLAAIATIGDHQIKNNALKKMIRNLKWLSDIAEAELRGSRMDYIPKFGHWAKDLKTPKSYDIKRGRYR